MIIMKRILIVWDSIKSSFIKRKYLFGGILLVACASLFVACEEPDEDPDPKEVYYSLMIDKQNIDSIFIQQNI